MHIFLCNFPPFPLFKLACLPLCYNTTATCRKMLLESQCLPVRTTNQLQEIYAHAYFLSKTANTHLPATIFKNKNCIILVCSISLSWHLSHRPDSTHHCSTSTSPWTGYTSVLTLPSRSTHLIAGYNHYKYVPPVNSTLFYQYSRPFWLHPNMFRHHPQPYNPRNSQNRTYTVWYAYIIDLHNQSPSHRKRTLCFPAWKLVERQTFYVTLNQYAILWGKCLLV